MSYRDFIAEHRRLFALQLLAEIGGSASEDIVYQGVRQGFRPIKGVTRDVIRADLDWMHNRHLLSYEWLDDTMLVVGLTERGAYVVSGDVEVEGVKVPDARR